MTGNDSAIENHWPCLVQACRWIYRTSWPSRQHDVDLAALVFDTWLSTTDGAFRRGAERDLNLLMKALNDAFSEWHPAEVVEHLCVVFAVALKQEARALDHIGTPRLS